MSLQGFSYAEYEDHGLQNYGLASTDNAEPLDWSKYGLSEFGAYIDQPLGMIDGEQIGLAMEYDEDDYVHGPRGALVRTKMLEMSPTDIAHCRRWGKPRLEAVAIADDGDIYSWTETPGYGGFFKKLVKRVKKRVKKVVKGVKKVAGKVKSGIKKASRRMIKALPGGKYLLKVYDKVKKVGMKLVKPLLKYVGPIAKKIAPIAALIPGYGPAIAAGLYKVGKMSDVIKKYKVKIDKAGRPIFKSGKQAAAVKKELEKAAQRMKSKGGGAGRRKGRRKSPRLLKTGSPEHRRRLQGYGLAGY